MSQSLPRLVTLEEHWVSPTLASSSRFQELFGDLFEKYPSWGAELRDASAGRVAAMKQHSIDLQVVSHTGGLYTLEECRSANDELYENTKANPNHIAGFAVLPVADPASCAEELTRCVKELGFKGALINHQTAEGTYFTGPEYDPMWKALEELDVPCYLHPTWLADHQMQALIPGSNVSKAAQKAIINSSWGWHADTASHVLQLHAAGVFDRFPKLNLVLGHFGEMIPFMLDRIEAFSIRYPGFKRGFKQVWNENIWITTSGVWSLDPLAIVLRNTSIDRIMFSIDYPFATLEKGVQWFKDLAASGMVDEDGLVKIAHLNAARLLRL
ncbi:hypothetical protein PRZ48_003111 [Zasmidium cellare]|uniref:Amidohydrolase-related domain-containing protein n=1 Tax=Zasmidium cellare TaxID=395010 RepID=A0ABR0EWC8_ZASCE|nr:hypothetical protein PRZ48_003111 [Zasmidium cellare]